MNQTDFQENTNIRNNVHTDKYYKTSCHNTQKGWLTQTISIMLRHVYGIKPTHSHNT